MHVDDPACSGDEATVDEFFNLLRKLMRFKPGGIIGFEKPVNYFGDTDMRTQKGFKVQVKDGYVDELVKQYLTTCRKVTTPATSETRPSTAEEKQTWLDTLNHDQHHQFRHGTGKLFFLSAEDQT